MTSTKELEIRFRHSVNNEDIINCVNDTINENLTKPNSDELIWQNAREIDVNTFYMKDIIDEKLLNYDDEEMYSKYAANICDAIAFEIGDDFTAHFKEVFEEDDFQRHLYAFYIDGEMTYYECIINEDGEYEDCAMYVNEYNKYELEEISESYFEAVEEAFESDEDIDFDESDYY